jgi:O-antigen ligase
MTLNSSSERILFYNIPTILFSLIPFLLITGPFLSDLSISLISLIFIYFCLKKKDFSYFKNKYFYFFLFFWFYLIINTLINNFNLDSLKISVFYFRYGVFVVAVISLLNYNDKFIKYFFYCIFFCFIILILDGFFQYITGKNIFGWKNTVRTSSFFGDEYILGSYLSRLWPIFFGLSIFIFKTKNKFFLLLILIFILSEVLIFLSGDRTAFFYINLSAIFVIFLSKKLFKLRLITLSFSILLIATISFFNPIAKERVFNKTIGDMNLKRDNTDNTDNEDMKLMRDDQVIYIFSKQHTHHYVTGYRIFMDNKFLGVGVKNFRNFCNDEKYKESALSCSTHPHNTYIQILSELGFIGFIFLFSAFFYFCKQTLKHLIERFKGKFYFSDFEICILSGIAIYIWPIVPTGNFFNNWLNIMFILNIPLLLWNKGKSNNNYN